MATKSQKNGGDLDTTLEKTYLEKNVKKISIISAIIVLVIVAILGGRYFLNARNQKAAEALFPCEHYFQAQQYDKALNGDGQQCIGFVAVADQYGCTKSGNVAKLYAGLSFYQLGQYEDAKKYLSKFSTKDDEMISPMALVALGNTYVQLGDTERGAETLVKAAKKAENALTSPLALVQAGEIYESLGNYEKALELYQQVKDRYPESMQAQDIDKYIERAKASK